MEVYLGDGLFGRMKFGTRYGYSIDMSQHLKELFEKYKELNRNAKDKILIPFTRELAKSLKEALKC